MTDNSHLQLKRKPINVDVSNLIPKIIKIKESNTQVIVKGDKVPEKIFMLSTGLYVINEVIKNLYIIVDQKKHKKIGSQPMIIAEKLE